MQRSQPFMKSEFLTDLLHPKRISFIVNPKAGTNLQRHIQDCVEKHLNNNQFEYDFKYTQHAGHARTVGQQIEKVDLLAFLLTLTDKDFLFNHQYSFPREVFMPKPKD